MLQDDSCYAKTKTLCCVFKILNISDYLYTFTIQRFRMTVVMQKRKPHAAFLRSWTSMIIAHFHQSTLQDDIFLSCWSAGLGMCVSGVDIQHLTIWVKLFKSMCILIFNDYLILSLLLRSWTSAIICTLSPLNASGWHLSVMLKRRAGDVCGRCGYSASYR